MTLRLALVGNSHLAALRQGWDDLGAEFPGCQVDFFGAPGHVWRRMRLEAGKVLSLPDDAGIAPALRDSLLRGFGAPSIDLGSYDAVVRVGDSIGEQEHAGLLAAFVIDGVPVTEGRAGLPRLSAAAYAECCAALAQTALPGRGWRGWAKPRLYLVAMPRPVETCAARAGEKMRHWVDLAAMSADTGPALAAYLPRVEALLAGAGLTLISPPPGLQGPSGLTRAAFARGSLNLIARKRLPEDEPRHMNAAYGAAMLRVLLDRLRADLLSSAPLRGVA